MLTADVDRGHVWRDMSLSDFSGATPQALEALASACGIEIPDGVDIAQTFRAARSLDRAGPNDLCVHLDGSDPEALIATRAGACLISARHRAEVPEWTIALVADDPLEAFLCAAAMLHRDGVLPSAFESKGIDRAAIVHPDASLESGVTVEPGAAIGPRVEIGGGTTIGANSVIGAGVRIGRGCAIDAHVCVRNALIGDRVVIQAGARIGAGSVFSGARNGRRVPCLGRVIVQDDVEIGANAIVACGYADDTMIGDGARIDALASIAGGITIARGARVYARDFSSGQEMV